MRKRAIAVSGLFALIALLCVLFSMLAGGTLALSSVERRTAPQTFLVSEQVSAPESSTAQENTESAAPQSSEVSEEQKEQKSDSEPEEPVPEQEEPVAEQEQTAESVQNSDGA